MAARERTTVPLSSRQILIGGALAGMLGAILMGFAGSAYIASIGGGWSTPMQAIAGTYYKSMAFVGGPGVTTIGVLTHLAIGGGFGVILAALTRRMRSHWGRFWIGIPFGIAVWALMTYVTLPVFDWVMLPRVEMMGVMWFFLHWIYGAFTGLVIPGAGAGEVAVKRRVIEPHLRTA